MEFATNSVRNNTLATTNDDPYYEIVTRFWHPYLTKINKLDPVSREMSTICEIDKAGGEIKLRFIDESKTTDRKSAVLGEWVKAGDILKLMPDKPGGILVDPEGVEYRWKTHNRNFQLIRCGDETRRPLVVYHPNKRHFFVWRMSKHASLEVKPQLRKYLDRIIASFLLVERQRRHHKV
ncbi:hypothetical protein C8J57DRAFT_1082590 [Mycena rebaudengoi]|nr:hypothetical protein C8J57DRAFT_1082590 [Mycena rebaudengoi]